MELDIYWSKNNYKLTLPALESDYGSFEGSLSQGGTSDGNPYYYLGGSLINRNTFSKDTYAYFDGKLFIQDSRVYLDYYQYQGTIQKDQYSAQDLRDWSTHTFNSRVQLG